MGFLDYMIRFSAFYICGNSVGQGVQLGELILGQGGLDGDGISYKLGVLKSGEYVPHLLAAGGSPAAVLHYCDLPSLEIVVCDVMEQVLHGDEYSGIIGGSCKDQVAASERIGEYIAGRGN